MRKYAGASCIALGILLSGFGLDSAESITERWRQLTSGWTVDQPMMVAGIVALTVGVVLWRRSGQAPPEKE